VNKAVDKPRISCKKKRKESKKQKKRKKEEKKRKKERKGVALKSEMDRIRGVPTETQIEREAGLEREKKRCDVRGEKETSWKII
jgi:hypothetical protein